MNTLWSVIKTILLFFLLVLLELACLGGMGITTALYPSTTLGSGLSGQGMTSDNVSPMNLVYIRKVGRRTSSAADALAALACGHAEGCGIHSVDQTLGVHGLSGLPEGLSEEKAEAIRKAIREIVRKLSGPAGIC